MNIRKIIGVSLACLVMLATVTLTTGCQESRAFNGATDKWHFIVVGDSRGGDVGVNSEIFTEIAAEIVRVNPDFVMLPGDLVTGSKDSKKLRAQFIKWRSIMQPVYDAQIPVYSVRGNHDLGSKKDSSGTDAWNEVFSGAYALPSDGPAGEENVTYSVRHKNALVIALDQYSIKGRHNNQEWLDGEFASNTSPHVFVMGHMPAFAVGHKDCLDDYPDQRNEFLASITRAGRRMYFCGHDHFFDHISADDDGDPSNDIHQLIVGTGGAPLRENDGKYAGDNSPYTITPVARAAKYGYMIVDVDGIEVNTTWVERIDANDYQSRNTWGYSVVGAGK